MNISNEKREELVKLQVEAKAFLATITKKDMEDPELNKMVLELQDMILFVDELLIEDEKMMEAA